MFSPEVLLQRRSLTLVIHTRTSCNIKIKHNKRNNSLGIILFFNNMSLSYQRPSCEPFTATSLTTQGFVCLSDNSGQWPSNKFRICQSRHVARNFDRGGQKTTKSQQSNIYFPLFLKHHPRKVHFSGAFILNNYVQI